MKGGKEDQDIGGATAPEKLAAVLLNFPSSYRDPWEFAVNFPSTGDHM